MNNTIDTDILQSIGLTRQTEQKASGELAQEDFLALMLAQLRNQDPFKPMESGEFLSQIAQFGTVTGIQDLQSSFSQLSGALQSNQALQASALVGRTVLVPSSTGVLTQEGALKGMVELPTSTTNLVVGIHDIAGQLVRRIELGPQAGGQVAFAWDGMSAAGDELPPGRYEVRASAAVGNDTLGVSTLVESAVESVTLGQPGQGLSLNLAGLGSVGLAQVTQIK